MRWTADSTGSCSQMRTTTHPRSPSRRPVSSSRAWLDRTFASQKSALAFALRWWTGQPCQKHPSTKIATRARGKRMSAVLRRCASGRLFTKYRSPRAWSARRIASSGPVSRPLLACIDARTAGLEAHERSSATRLTLAGPYQAKREVLGLEAANWGPRTAHQRRPQASGA